MGGQVVLDLPSSPHAESRNGCRWVGSRQVLVDRMVMWAGGSGSVGLALGTRNQYPLGGLRAGGWGELCLSWRGSGDRHGRRSPRDGPREEEVSSAPKSHSASSPHSCYVPSWPLGLGPLWREPQADWQTPPRNVQAGGSAARMLGSLADTALSLCVPRPRPTTGSTLGRRSSFGSGSAWGSLASLPTTSMARAASSSSRPATASSTAGTGARTASW